MDIEINDVIKSLAEKNDIRMTHQRRKILEILIENKDRHVCVEEIYNLSKEKNNVIALPTIYRTMDILEKIGAVIKHDFGDGAAKYEFFEKEKGVHHHLICKRCGKIIEISGLLSDDLSKRLLEEKGFQSKGQYLKIYGYCKECMNELKNSFNSH